MNEENTPQVPNYEGEPMKMPENSRSTEANVEKSSVINTPILFTLGILLLVILGGMYYWFSTLEDAQTIPTPTVERPTAEENNEPESTTAEAQAGTMLTTSTSDEIEAIEADIEGTNLETLDAELDAIDAELDASMR